MSANRWLNAVIEEPSATDHRNHTLLDELLDLQRMLDNLEYEFNLTHRKVSEIMKRWEGEDN